MNLKQSEKQLPSQHTHKKTCRTIAYPVVRISARSFGLEATKNKSQIKLSSPKVPSAPIKPQAPPHPHFPTVLGHTLHIHRETANLYPPLQKPLSFYFHISLISLDLTLTTKHTFLLARIMVIALILLMPRVLLLSVSSQKIIHAALFFPWHLEFDIKLIHACCVFPPAK